MGKVSLADVESVADHTFGVTYLALLLAKLENALRTAEPLNIEQVLTKAVLHDLVEARYLDLDRSTTELLGPDEDKRWKSLLDSRATEGLTTDWEGLAVAVGVQPEKGQVLAAALHEAVVDKTSPEARLVEVADKLDLYLQAQHYVRRGRIQSSEAEPFIRSALVAIKQHSAEFQVLIGFAKAGILPPG